MNHNRRHKTNMERMSDCIAAAGKIVGAHTRKNPANARKEDFDRVSWRLDKGLEPLQYFDDQRYDTGAHGEWIDIHTRKTSGTPLSKWTPEEKEVIRKFIEAIDDVGTRAY